MLLCEGDVNRFSAQLEEENDPESIKDYRKIITKTNVSAEKTEKSLKEKQENLLLKKELQQKFLENNLVIQGFSASSVWRLLIDGRHQSNNDPLIYDKQRSPELNEPGVGEPGYLRAMEKAFIFINRTLEEPLSVNFLILLHGLAVRNVFRFNPDTPEEYEKHVTTKADISGIRSKNIVTFLNENNSTVEGVNEIKANYTFVSLTDYFGRYICHANYRGEGESLKLFLTQKLQQFIEEYNLEVTTDNRDDKIRAIARLVHKIDLLHGTTRMLVLIIQKELARNKLIAEHGFPSPIIENPNLFGGYSEEQVFRQVGSPGTELEFAL